MKTKPQFPIDIKDYYMKANLPQLTEKYSQFLPSTNVDDLAMTKVKADTLVRLASFDLDAIRFQADANVRMTEVQADAAVSIERIKAHAAMYHDYTAMETERIQAHSRVISDLIGATSATMSQALQPFRDYPGSYKVTVKSKLGWFGPSCKMTVKAEAYPIVYHRGPIR